MKRLFRKLWGLRWLRGEKAVLDLEAGKVVVEVAMRTATELACPECGGEYDTLVRDLRTQRHCGGLNLYPHKTS